MKRPGVNMGWSCLVFFLSVLPAAFAQDETGMTEEQPKAPAATAAPAILPVTEAQRQEAAERQKMAKLDYELRYRLENTVWNDMDLLAGQAGQVWMFRPVVTERNREVRPWYMNDAEQLPRVGSWDVKNGEIRMLAMNGNVVARGKLVDDEITGTFVHRDGRREFGRFRLREETKRNYRVLSKHIQRDPGHKQLIPIRVPRAE